MLSLNIKVRLVLFAPFYLCPYTLVIKHEESFENGITTGNFRSNLDIFREQRLLTKNFGSHTHGINDYRVVCHIICVIIDTCKQTSHPHARNTNHSLTSNDSTHTKPAMDPLLFIPLGQIQPIALPILRGFEKFQFVKQRFGVVPIVAMRHGATPDQSEIPVRNIRCSPPRFILRVGRGRLLQPIGVAHQYVFRGRFPRCRRWFGFFLLPT